jgi:hypothetical protein
MVSDICYAFHAAANKILHKEKSIKCLFQKRAPWYGGMLERLISEIKQQSRKFLAKLSLIYKLCRR